MKKIKLLAIAIVALFAAHTSFAGAQDFILVNATDHTILSVYLSPSSHSGWESDVLSGYLYAGDWTRVRVTGYSDDLWDIKIVYRDSKPDAIYMQIPLKQIYKLVLRDNAQGGTTMTKHYL